MRVLRVSHSAVVDAWRERERALRARGHEVHLVSAVEWNEGGAPVRLHSTPDEQTTGAGTFGCHPALFLYDPRPIWRLLGERWDVIDIHEEPFALATAEILLLRALRRQRAPYVIYSAQNLAKRYPPPFRWFERRVLRGAAGASVCNVEAGRILSRKGLPARPRLIPLGTDLARFNAGASTRTESRHGSALVGYAGRLEQHKGVGVLLDAVAQTPALRVRLAGGGSLRLALEARAQSADLAGRVEFVGPLAQDDLADFYRSVEVMAVPSLTTPSWVEQFGRVAVEAMACGIPVVASDSGALPDVVGSSGVLVRPGDAAGLGEALLRVGTDPALRDRLVKAGLDTAARTSWGEVARRYEDLYCAALGPRRKSTGRQAAYGDVLGETDSMTGDHPLEVVVVAYGAPDLLRTALAGVRGLPVVVVDNSSRTDVRDIALEHDARYVDPGCNAGFASGVNIGLAQSTPGADVLLLNPDARVSSDDVAKLQRAMRSAPDVASVTPRIRHPDGSEERSSWPFPSPLRAWLEAFGAGRLLGGPEFVVGTVLLLRAEAVEQVGGFDEDFFLYAEETDWARRAQALGWRHAVVRAVTVSHVGAGTSTDHLRRETHFHAGQERYYRKHYGALGWQAARAAQLTGSSLRAMLGGVRAEPARLRRSLYLRGPMRVEAPLLPKLSRRGEA